MARESDSARKSLFTQSWFELRWGICGLPHLTVALITTVFYNHPSTSNATLFFRTVPILPETNGRVAEIFIGSTAARSPKARRSSGLDNSKQEAAVETARRKSRGDRRTNGLARVDVTKAEGQLKEARSNHQQTVDELEAKQELIQAQSGQRSLPRDRAAPGTRNGPTGRNRCCAASKQSIEERISTLLPAERPVPKRR